MLQLHRKTWDCIDESTIDRGFLASDDPTNYRKAELTSVMLPSRFAAKPDARVTAIGGEVMISSAEARYTQIRIPLFDSPG